MAKASAGLDDADMGRTVYLTGNPVK
jgi:hypothetical protein